MPGASLLREGEHRTVRGGIVTIREWWNRRRRTNAYRLVQATSSTGVIAEYFANRPGNAAIVFELYSAGIFDLSTTPHNVPPLLGRELGRAWLKAEDGRCGREHFVGSTKDCAHVENGVIQLPKPSIHAGADELKPASPTAPVGNKGLPFCDHGTPAENCLTCSWVLA